MHHPLTLFFREYGRGEPALVILHGLLGSSQNWQRAAKIFVADNAPRGAQKCRVLVVDQRNHGNSPHAATHTFADLREDIKHFFDQQHLDKAYLLGHSMGGVAAMEFAFHYPKRLAGLIVEDIAPRAYQSSSGDILAALAEIDLNAVASREQAEAMLAPKIKSERTRQFVLTNLIRRDDNTFAWKVNLPVLLAAQQEMATYAPPLNTRYSGKTLFVGGELSDYRIDRDHDLILRYFPNSRLVMIPNVGHWIHFEAAEAFTEVVVDFMSG